MPLKRLFGVSHLPQGGNYGNANTGFGLAMLNLAFPFTRAFNASYAGIWLTVENDAIVLGKSAGSGAAGTGVGCTGIRVAGMFGADTLANAANINRLVLGVRITKGPRMPQRTIAIWSTANRAIDTSLSGTGNTGIAMNLSGQFGYFSSVAPVQAFTVLPGDPSSAYIEFVWEKSGTTATVKIYVDGQFLFGTNEAVTLAQFLTNATSNFMMGEGPNGAGIIDNTGSRNIYVQYSDIYTLVDDGTVGDTMNDRLGPIRLKRVPILSADANNWTTSNSASIPSVLNQRRDNDGTTDTTTLPAVTNAADQSALSLNLDLSQVVNPIAVQVAASAARTAATPGNLALQTRYNGPALQDQTFSDLSTAASPLDRTLLPLVALGSDPLNKANLANLKIQLAPN